MSSNRWDEIQALFHAAADLPATDWEGFLRGRTSDESLVRDVLAMLAKDAAGATMLDRGIAPLAHRVIAQDAGQPPPDFGPYRIKELLGEGGMGVVYRAERTDVGSVVAIKILRDAWLSPARRGRFAREQRLLAQLNHPSIARLMDAGAYPDGTPWFVMEYVDGVPITDHCRKQRAGLEERLRLFRDVCAAVQHAHENLVIHRDLKPSNILVDAAGKVKLLDFGISKQIDARQHGVDATRTEMRLMTPAYASPEQLRGSEGAVDTDVYSLGVVLYELLLGRLPFDVSTRTPAEIEQLISSEPIERPSLVVARGTGAGRDVTAVQATRPAWADVDVLCLTAMHRDRTRRYHTVAALMRDVDHFLAGQPLEARPDDLRYRTGKYVRRNWRPLLGATVVLIGLASAGVFFTVRLRSARDAALAEATRTQRIQRFTLSLFQADKDTGPTDDLKAITLVDRGAQEARSLASEPVVQAELYATLGGIYQKLGKQDRAEQLLVQALQQRRALLGEPHPDVARSLIDLGMLRSDQARYDDAERLVRDGLTRIGRASPADTSALVKASSALGEVLENRGAYQQAIPVLDRAVQILRGSGAGESAEMADTLGQLANNHFYLGQHDDCRRLSEQAMALNKKVRGDRHPSVSAMMINIGAVDAERGNYPAAERTYRQALAITEAWFGQDHPQYAIDLTMLARVIQQQERFDEATGMLHKALSLKERVYGKFHPSVASTLNDLGAIALRRQQYEPAAAAFRRNLEIYRAVYKDGHQLTGIALSNLATVDLNQDRYAEAEPLFREAIAMFSRTLPASHLNIGIARIKLGRTLLRQKRPAEAMRETRAGYEILHKQMNPATSWMKSARNDLAAAYSQLGQHERAAEFTADAGAPP